jgi:hypothetical protein
MLAHQVSRGHGAGASATWHHTPDTSSLSARSLGGLAAIRRASSRVSLHHRHWSAGPAGIELAYWLTPVTSRALSSADLLAYSPCCMAFAIQWTDPTGPATAQRNSPVEAIKCAVEMLGKGCTDVVIVDLAENGKTYRPADFAQFHKVTRK